MVNVSLRPTKMVRPCAVRFNLLGAVLILIGMEMARAVLSPGWIISLGGSSLPLGARFAVSVVPAASTSAISGLVEENRGLKSFKAVRSPLDFPITLTCKLERA